MEASLRDSIEQVSDPRHLDASVEEAFALMLGCECRRVADVGPEVGQSLVAVVGFGGVLSGACVIRCSAHSAIRMAERITGDKFTELDATVQDAVGEICNIVAGSWKGRIPQLSANCGLSVPAVVTGTDYKFRVHAQEFKLVHCYRFDDSTFECTILCEGLH